MTEEEKNNNYHTVLPYTKLHEEDKAEYEAYKVLSPEEKKETHKRFRPSFLNYFQKSGIIMTLTEYYHDIVNDNGRPDYRTIEILYLMAASGIHDEEDFAIYNGYKVKMLHDGGILIYLGALLELGSNLNLHLLSYLTNRAYQEEFPVVKKSCIKLQEFFNETEENIRHALISLKNLNLITFSEENNGDLVINLNKDNILKLDKKHANYSYLTRDFLINKHYKEYATSMSCPHCLEGMDEKYIQQLLKYYQTFKN
jgi:hypothetical protein